MKVTVENKKGLKKDLKVFIDKKTISTYMNDKYEEVKKNVVIKGFRPGKVPVEVLKNQFGKVRKVVVTSLFCGLTGLCHMPITRINPNILLNYYVN